VGWKITSGSHSEQVEAIKLVRTSGLFIKALDLDCNRTSLNFEEFVDIVGSALHSNALVKFPLLEDFMERFESTEIVKEMLWRNAENLTKQTRLAVFQVCKSKSVQNDCLFEKQVSKIISSVLRLPIRTL
jgi:hypothetical protein